MQFDDYYLLPENIIARLQNALQARAQTDHREWIISYFRIENTPVRGVRMQDIRLVVHRWHRAWEAEAQLIPQETERLVALQLLQEPHLDDKLAALVFIHEVLIMRQRLLPSHLPLFEPIFAADHINNRKVGDEFASKVLTPMMERAPTQVSAALRDRWITAPQLWQARAALMALTPLAQNEMHREAILAGSEVLVERRETEAKSVAGSALRELSKYQPETVQEFLNDDENLILFDAGSLAKATDCFEETEARRLRNRRRALQVSRGPPSGGTELSRRRRGEVGAETVSGDRESGASGMEQGAGVHAAVLPGVAAAQDVGGARDPLGIGLGMVEELGEGLGGGFGLPSYESDVARTVGGDGGVEETGSIQREEEVGESEEAEHGEIEGTVESEGQGEGELDGESEDDESGSEEQ